MTVTRRQTLAAVAGGLSPAGELRVKAATDAAAVASGIVFEDPDARLTPGPLSVGIAGVMVSNGRDVVVTDAAGRYSLPVTPGQSVFVIKPPGFALPVQVATRLPVFAYVHAPDGSPEGFLYPGLLPTGELPGTLDFPLRRQAEPGAFQALLLTDPQPETLAELAYVRDDMIAAAAAEAGAALLFGIAHGDLMFDDLSFYARYNRLMATVGVPIHSVPGNHDINIEAPDDSHSRDTFIRVFGARRHAFRVGRATFLLLDNVEYLGPDPAKPGQLGRYRGRFGEAQLAFVRNVLAQVPKDDLVVASFHIPLRTLAGSDAATANTDTAAFLDALSTHPNSLSFAGHTHTNEHHYLGAEDGFAAGIHHHHVLAAVSGSWWSGPFDVRGIPVALQSDGCPSGYHVLSVDGVDHDVRFVPSHDPARGQMRIMFDNQLHANAPEVLRDYAPGALLSGPVSLEAVPSVRVLVNLFDGGPRSTVALSVAGSPLQPMQRVTRTDPWVEEVYARHAATKKPWVRPGLSSHLWQAPLPADLSAGVHRVSVLATDEYGRPHVATAVLEVAAV